MTMSAMKADYHQEAGMEKTPMGTEGQLTPNASMNGEIIIEEDDDGEVFKKNADHAQFRALGM